MATLGLAQKHANILSGGIASWHVKWGIGETPDDAYYSLGELAEASVRIDVIGTTGEYGQNSAYVCRLEASAKMLCTNKTTVLELLHNLSNAQLAHRIVGINGTHNFKGNFGMGWKFDASASYNGDRFIQLTARHHFLLSHATEEDLADVMGASPAIGTPDVGDTLYTWSATQRFPAGIKAITIDPAGDAETVGKFSGASFVAEAVTTEDELMRNIGNNTIRLSAGFTMLQTLEEAAFVGANLPSGDACVMTFADGTIATVSTYMNPLPVFEVPSGADSTASIKMEAKKVIKSSDWAGIIS